MTWLPSSLTTNQSRASGCNACCKTEPDLRLLPACADGRSAVAAIQERRPDLLFLDVQMPEMTASKWWRPSV